MKKILLILSLVIPVAAYAGDLDIETIIKGAATVLLLNELHKEQHRHDFLPRSEFGIYYEPIDGRISRTHCPIREHVYIYNKYGNRKEYIVRDCRR